MASPVVPFEQLGKVESTTLFPRRPTSALTGLTGGGAANLDGLDVANLAVGDRIVLSISGVSYGYTLTTSGAAESSPTVIEPDTGNSNVRWILDGISLGTSQVSGNLTVTGTLTVQGTSTHTFSGPVTVDLSQNASTWLRVRNTNAGAGAAAGVLLTNDGGDLGALSVYSSGNSPANAVALRSLSTNDVVIMTNMTNVAATFSGLNTTLGGTLTTAAPTGGAGAWKLGIANVVSPTSPNRTIAIDIGGTVYYLAAKTTNN